MHHQHSYGLTPFLFKKDEAFLDIGAYTGDTLQTFDYYMLDNGKDIWDSKQILIFFTS